MCGIFGAVSAAGVDEAGVARARDVLAHRGPDGAGIWKSPDGRACLAHRRLAVLDPTPHGAQPFASPDGRTVVVFNGEIYNFRALRGELEAEGARFTTRSDTEVLLHAWRRWGAGCLERLSGMFAFAVWDAAEGTLFCARDRAGEKPLYWSVVGDTFVFGSELKALLAWPGMPRELDALAMAEYLHFGFVGDPRSIWRGVSKLPPGHSLTVRLGAGGLRVGAPSRWWDFTFAPDRSVRDWSPVILDTLAAAVGEMSVSDVPLGAFLSGGVDSSAVAASLARGGHSVSAYTIGFDDDPDDERAWAAQVAERYRLDHRVREVAACDMAASRDTLAWHFDEPFSDPSALPTLHVCRHARDALTVALSGDGADELFGGYRRYRYLAARDREARWLPRPVGRNAARVIRAALPRRSRARGRLARYALDRESLFVEMLTIGHDAGALRRAARGPLAAALAEYCPRERVRELLRALPADVPLVDAMRYLDVKLTLANGMLVKVDRASMAVSLEVRAVFLHRDMLALAGRIPADRLLHGGIPKHALKQALRAWLPDDLLFRRKRGFTAPVGRWMRADAAGAETPTAAPRGIDEYIDPALLGGLRREHAQAAADRSRAIGNVETLADWLDSWR